jgi:hypothetical protein
MPNHVLLLGAGFSRNWHAPLAAEVANSLLLQLEGDAHLQAPAEAALAGSHQWASLFICIWSVLV